jgi:hypothetical protein
MSTLTHTVVFMLAPVARNLLEEVIVSFRKSDAGIPPMEGELHLPFSGHSD